MIVMTLIGQVDSSDSGSYMRTRRHEKRTRRGRRGLLNEETGRNRLQTRALYDTETEAEVCEVCVVLCLMSHCAKVVLKTCI